MTQFYSRTDTVYDGGEAIFSFSFSYTKKADIHVFIDDVELPYWVDGVTQWEWLNASQIKVTAPLEIGVTVSVRRITPIQDKIVTYENMSMILDDDNLNLSQDQLLNATQELYDNSEQFTLDVEKEITDKIQANTDLINQNKLDTDKQIADNKKDTDKQIADNKLDTDNQIETNKQDTDNQIATNKQDTDQQLTDYEATMDKKFQDLVDTIGKVYVYKGSVPTYDDLPKVNNEIGDVWNVVDTDVNYAWDGTRWDSLGGVVDTKALVTTNTKQDIIETKTFKADQYIKSDNLDSNNARNQLGKALIFTDKNNKQVGGIGVYYNNNGTPIIRTAVQNDNGIAFSGVGITPDGKTKFFELPDNPPMDSNNKDAASTKWCNDKFVKKSGDTMTGALKFEDSGYIERNNSPSTKGLALFGDKDGYGTGASFALRSNLASGSQAGAFKLETGNNVTGHTHTLQGSPDGSFTCDGKEIVRTINGIEADKKGNVVIEQPVEVPNGYLVGSPSYDEKIYNQMEKQYHSTFDKSKFQIVGSPSVSDNGVASEFSENNYINTNTAKDNIKYPFYIKSKVYVREINFLQNIWAFETWQFRLYITRENKLSLLYNTTDNHGGFYGFKDTRTIKVGDVIETVCKFDKDREEFRVTVNGKELIYTANRSSTLTTFDKPIVIGNWYRGISEYFKGSIDLKQFSVIVDGKEVFNGNKAGVDVVKPDNFTKVGNPVISDDGVASEFSNANYLEKNIEIEGLIDIDFEFIYKKSTKDLSSPFLSKTNISKPDQLGPIITSANDRLVINGGFGYLQLEEGKKYKCRVSTDCKTYVKLYYNGEDVSRRYYDSATPFKISSLRIGKGAINDTYFTSLMNLNSFKVYVEGELVYQPLLRIPYNLTEHNEKYVEGAYRDRVIDVVQQYGKTIYPTIDTTNKNFMIQNNGIYGFEYMERLKPANNLIMDKVISGVHVRLWEDGTLEQSGKFTISDTWTVTLARPYANTDYLVYGEVQEGKGVANLGIDAKTTTNFSGKCSVTTHSAYWYTKGIAQSKEIN